MKLLILMMIVLSSSAFSMSRSSIELLLRQKNISLSELENRGERVLVGEVTGHTRVIPFSRVKIILTEREAILRHEIEGASFSGAEVMGNISSLRFNGQYILKEDIRGAVVGQ